MFVGVDGLQFSVVERLAAVFGKFKPVNEALADEIDFKGVARALGISGVDVDFAAFLRERGIVSASDVAFLLAGERKKLEADWKAEQRDAAKADRAKVKAGADTSVVVSLNKKITAAMTRGAGRGGVAAVPVDSVVGLTADEKKLLERYASKSRMKVVKRSSVDKLRTSEMAPIATAKTTEAIRSAAAKAVDDLVAKVTTAMGDSEQVLIDGVPKLGRDQKRILLKYMDVVQLPVITPESLVKMMEKEANMERGDRRSYTTPGDVSYMNTDGRMKRDSFSQGRGHNPSTAGLSPAERRLAAFGYDPSTGYVNIGEVPDHITKSGPYDADPEQEAKKRGSVVRRRR